MVPLPPYARRIEYLESTGTQWIIADPTDSWDRFVAVFQPTSNANAQRLITDVNGQRCIYVNNTGKMAASMDATWQSTNLVPDQYKFEVEYNVADKKTYFNTTDGTTLAVTIHSSALALVQPKIFAYQSSVLTSYYPGYMRLFNITAWDALGTLVRSFVPCRILDVGYLWDEVEGKFYGNQGTGSFVLGPDVREGVVPTRLNPFGVGRRQEEIRRVEYLEST